ncbi:UDP-phosphate N-acetylgalactosaminyl-1-phosphate transferase [Clostridium taeniosporum]|uniref:UDP-phosphate N-acetylgalactosaminyl-1-phosphate transferase n=1 Tax=Clostridium taeniosporum TaxID=394958 RepID=A0A1D7XP54_9CLOT|nr:UDP-phosphate N-acetylgalactosaminyl-1-phosphate transferase [Clostridium taeniosporum]
MNVVETLDKTYIKVEKKLNINYKEKQLYEFIKRILDLLFSIIALVIAVPIILVTCILVRLESKGNPIYSQERLGKNGRKFSVYKIRSMYTDAEKNGPQWAGKNDNRVTKIGKFIRKTRIDELPQLFNILKGEMSIVGPRPEREYFIEKFSKDIPNFKQRLLVIPGLTGYAQINGGYDITPLEKLELDLKYIENRGVIEDFKIMLKTVKIVLTGNGAR